MITIGFLSLGLYVLIVLAGLGQSEKQRENEPNTVILKLLCFLKIPGWAFFSLFAKYGFPRLVHGGEKNQHERVFACMTYLPPNSLSLLVLH